MKATVSVRQLWGIVLSSSKNKVSWSIGEMWLKAPKKSPSILSKLNACFWILIGRGCFVWYDADKYGRQYPESTGFNPKNFMNHR